MQNLIECNFCKVNKQLDKNGILGRFTPLVITQIMESLARVRHGSVEIKVQNNKIVQIDILEKQRLT